MIQARQQQQQQQQQQQHQNEEVHIVKPQKRRRKKKDPNAPKRPKSGFMFFMVQNRARIVAEQQLDTKKVTGIGRAVGVEWRATENTPDRKRYEKLAAEDKVRYANEVASYKAQNPVIKKPISAYMFFVQDVRPRLRIENPGLDFSSLGRLLGSTWKNLGVEDKAPFAQKAEADKMRYVAEIAACPEQPMKVSGSSSMAQRI